VEPIAASEPFHDGFLASRVDLLVLRGVTVAGRGADGDLLDFRWLLTTAAERGLLLPRLNRDKVEALKEVAGILLWWEALVLLDILREEDFVLFSSI